MKCPKCQWPSSPEHQSTLQYHHTEDGRYYQCNDCGLVWTEWQQEQIALLEARLKDAEEVIETIRFVHDSISNSRDVDAEMEIEALNDKANAYFKRKAQREGE